jgi:hypothetical protein
MKLNQLTNSLGIVAVLACAPCGNSETTEQPATNETVAAPVAAPLATVKDMQWLTGWWQHVTPGGIAFEEWTLNGEAMAGRGGFIKGKDTMVSETVTLEQQGSDLMYIPTVKDQNSGQPVPFKLTVATADSFVFENPQHDFPSKITYRKVSDTVLVARISGTIEGKEQAEAFELAKVR